jgi:hypothetical protein
MRITTAAERAQMKPGTIAVDDQGNAWKRGTGSWVSTREDGFLHDDDDYPMTILIEGGKSGDPEVKRLRGERRELLKHLDSWESQGHTNVTIKYLRRHFGAA